MSFTKTVPAAVPSVFHSSLPCVPPLAVKYVTPLTTTGLFGLELVLVLMSLTRRVPVAVPSLMYSS